MKQWRALADVCQRWKQVICESPRYLDLQIYCSNGTDLTKNLNCWPELPISLSYRVPENEEDPIALLKKRDRVRFVRLDITSRSSLKKVAAAMLEPFPVLTHLEISGCRGVPVLPSEFMGMSAPRLEHLRLDRIPFPGLPTLLLSAHNLVFLRLDNLHLTGYISPEAMVEGLATLTRLKMLTINFIFSHSPSEQMRTHPDLPVRAVLSELTAFKYRGSIEYLEDLVAIIDAPQLYEVKIGLDQLDPESEPLEIPQLSSFLSRANPALAENLRFTRAQVVFHNEDVDIVLDRFDRANVRVGPHRPYISLSFSSKWSNSFEWSSSHMTHVRHVLEQIFALSSDVVHLYIHVSDNHPSWDRKADELSWAGICSLFDSVRTLHLSGSWASQYARALPEGAWVLQDFPSLHSLLLSGDDDLSEHADQIEAFGSSRKRYGRPVVIKSTSFDLPSECNYTPLLFDNDNG